MQGKLNVHDSIFIYYAGHGHLDTGSNAGFWIPVDGGTDQYSQENWLPNNQIRGYISRFKTTHVFMISDACFSGDILDRTRALPPQIDNAYYRRAYSRVSRQVMSSGSSESVPDSSEFAFRLKQTLERNEAACLDSMRIFDNVREVKTTQPLLGIIPNSGHQSEGSFIFFKRDKPLAGGAPVPARETVLPPADDPLPKLPMPGQSLLPEAANQPLRNGF